MKLTVKELKTLIKDLPDDLSVVIDGYERGISEVEQITITKLYSYKDSECSVYGEFINNQDQFFDNEKTKPIFVKDALYLSR